MDKEFDFELFKSEMMQIESIPKDKLEYYIEFCNTTYSMDRINEIVQIIARDGDLSREDVIEGNKQIMRERLELVLRAEQMKVLGIDTPEMRWFIEDIEDD